VGILLIGLVNCTPGRLDTAETASTGVAKIGPAIDGVHTDNVSGLHELRAVLVSVDGEVVAERYYGSDPAEYADLQSVTKSIVSILAGIAIGEGKISGVDATLEDLLPEHRKDMDGRTKRTTLRQLLTMTAGWTDSTPPANRDLLRAWFREGPELQPGEQFRYTNIGPHIVAHVLRRATGMSLLDYARQKLFDPLEIPTRPVYEARFGEEVPYWVEPEFLAADFAWLRAPDGVHAGSFAMKLRPTDMLKLGQLYLDEGDGKESNSCQRTGSSSRRRPMRLAAMDTSGGSTQFKASTGTQRSAVAAKSFWSRRTAGSSWSPHRTLSAPTRAATRSSG